MGALQLSEITTYLDDYLDIAQVPDYPDAWNGLQVENGGTVRKFAASTDACQATFASAAESGADLLLVHHGLFWGKGITPLTDRSYRRVRELITHDIALYSVHLPLDSHPEVGNNIQLARAVGLDLLDRFGEYEGYAIGYRGELEIGRAELAGRLEGLLGQPPFVIPAGPETVRRVGVVSGGAAALLSQAREAGLDTFITGEGPHHSFFDAQEWGVNVLYGGHYATETLGIKALGRHVAEKFGLEWQFIDHPTGL